MTQTAADRWARFDSWDRRGTIVMLVLVAVAAAVAPVTHLVQALRGGAVTIDGVPVKNLGDVGRLGEGTVVEPVFAPVRLPDPSALERLAAAGPSLAIAALVITGVVLLARLVNDIEQGRPFGAVNVRRLRALALMVIVGGGFVVPFLEGLAQIAAQGSLDDAGFMMTVQVVPLVVGLVLAALAQAFDRGTDLEHEVEGLV